MIRIEAAVKSYGRNAALDGASFVFGSELCVLLGANGAGKSTLLRALATVESLDSGSIVVGGQLLESRASIDSYRARLGWLPQTFGYEPSARVIDYLKYFAWLKLVPKAKVEWAVETALDAVGLADRATARLSTLSGGMIRRLGIAQAIVNSPDVVLLDEPTAGLDPVQRRDFYDLARSVLAGKSVLLATHLVEDVEEVADTVVVMAHGRTTWQGSIGELVAQKADGDGLLAVVRELMGPAVGAPR